MISTKKIENASDKVPLELRHIAIIMDGNRRWAKDRGLMSFQGHEAGYTTMRAITDYAFSLKIPHLTFFAFSTENWKRSEQEVSFLLNLVAKMLSDDIAEIHEKGIRLNFLGDISAFSSQLQTLMREGMELTKDNTGGMLNLAMNYGGRDEIVNAVKKIVAEGVESDAITEGMISDHLYTAGQPDPDMIIRTSGEKRLSGFLPWQGVYGELYFIEKHWPDFNEQDLDEALAEYGRRSRRFGK